MNQVIGIVKTQQLSTPKASFQVGVTRESAMHQLYILANNISLINNASSSSTSSTTTTTTAVLSDGNNHDNTHINNDATTSVYSGSAFSWLELQRIRSIAMNEQCCCLLIASLSPLICGHELVKLGLLLSLFGGTNRLDTSNSNNNNSDIDVNSSDKTSSDSFHIRDNIHVLMVGDPGIGKVCLAQYC